MELAGVSKTLTQQTHSDELDDTSTIKYSKIIVASEVENSVQGHKTKFKMTPSKNLKSDHLFNRLSTTEERNI